MDVDAEEQREEGSEESEESEMQNLEQEEFDGVLREEMVTDALSELGRSGPGTEQVYLSLSLKRNDLVNINILHNYIHLQKLDLSGNKIEDLSCVSFMPYLLELNASQNRLTTFFDFSPPKNLKKVDFSSNKIFGMNDLSAYRTLTQLILDSILWMHERETLVSSPIEEGVTDYTERQQISDFPKVCNSCN